MVVAAIVAFIIIMIAGWPTLDHRHHRSRIMLHHWIERLSRRTQEEQS